MANNEKLGKTRKLEAESCKKVEARPNSTGSMMAGIISSEKNSGGTGVRDTCARDLGPGAENGGTCGELGLSAGVYSVLSGGFLSLAGCHNSPTAKGGVVTMTSKASGQDGDNKDALYLASGGKNSEVDGKLGLTAHSSSTPNDGRISLGGGFDLTSGDASIKTMKARGQRVSDSAARYLGSGYGNSEVGRKHGAYAVALVLAFSRLRVHRISPADGYGYPTSRGESSITTSKSGGLMVSDNGARYFGSESGNSGVGEELGGSANASQSLSCACHLLARGHGSLTPSGYMAVKTTEARGKGAVNSGALCLGSGP